MPVTIKDVARNAGVSLSTVSLVINNKANVSPAMRAKVERAIHDLNFHPRRNARGLASKKTHNLGFILTDNHFSFTEPFYTKVFLGTEFEGRKHNYYILLTTVPKTFKDDDSVVPRFLLEKNVDGVILAGKVPVKLLEYIHKLKLPIVLVDYCSGRVKTSCVLIDNNQGMQLAVKHLLEHGHRQIAFIGADLQHPSIFERLAGYKTALQENQIAADENLIFCSAPDLGPDEGYKAAQELENSGQKFTAIVAANDAMAIGAMRFLKEKEYKIPSDISIIGFDDVEICLQTEPRLTTIRVLKEELGAIAVRRIVETINEGTKIINRVTVPVELKKRDSVAPVRYD